MCALKGHPMKPCPKPQPVPFGDDNDHIITRHRTSTKKDCWELSNHFVGAETERTERIEWNKDLALLRERGGWSILFPLAAPPLLSQSLGVLSAATVIGCPAETISRRIRRVKRQSAKPDIKIFRVARCLANLSVFEKEKKKEGNTVPCRSSHTLFPHCPIRNPTSVYCVGILCSTPTHSSESEFKMGGIHSLFLRRS